MVIAVAGTVVLVLALWPSLLPPPGITTPDREAVIDPELSALIDRHVRAARREPRRALPRGTLGLVYEANKLWPEALSCYRNATALEEGEPTWSYHAAIAWMQTDDLDGARRWMRKYAERFPTYAPLHHRLGVALLDAGEFEEAKAAFEKVISRVPTSASGYVGLGDVMLRTKEHAEAARLLEHAVDLEPDDKTARYLLGLAYRALGRLDDAERELRLGAGASQRFIADDWSARLSEFDLSIGSRLVRATKLIREGEPAEAATVLEGVLSAEPDNVDALINLGTAYLHIGRLAESINTLLHAERLTETRFELYINLAACLRASSRPAEALEYADKAVALAPDVAQTNHARGLALMQLGRNEEALESLKTAVGLDARSPRIVQDLANACVRLQRFTDALGHFQTLVKLLPTRWEPRLGVAKLNLLLGRFDEAEKALEAGLQMAPDEPRLHALAQRLSELRDP